MSFVASLLPVLLATQATAVSLQVTGSRFYVELSDADLAVTSIETTQVPYAVGLSCYRWELRVKSRPGVSYVTEVLTLPAAPQLWGGVDGTPESPTRLSPSRQVATTELVVPTLQGKFGNGWCVAEGDPEGRYSIEVRQGARLLRRFDFTVGEGATRAPRL